MLLLACLARSLSSAKHAFELLVLAVESFVQISNVNSIDAKRSTLMVAVNTCCGVALVECRAKHSLYD